MKFLIKNESSLFFAKKSDMLDLKPADKTKGKKSSLQVIPEAIPYSLVFTIVPRQLQPASRAYQASSLDAIPEYKPCPKLRRL